MENLAYHRSPLLSFFSPHSASHRSPVHVRTFDFSSSASRRITLLLYRSGHRLSVVKLILSPVNLVSRRRLTCRRPSRILVAFEPMIKPGRQSWSVLAYEDDEEEETFAALIAFREKFIFPKFPFKVRKLWQRSFAPNISNNKALNTDT